MRYFLTLAYRGAPFHGWQRQPADSSVQQAIEEALATILRLPETPDVTGAGRTDAGVNASMMVAHVDLPSIADTHGLIRSLNSLLGPDIAVRAITPVAADAHARFDATSRTYHYYAATRRTPFGSGLVWQAPPTLDFEAMNRAARLLLDTRDFTSFSKLHTQVKTNICQVTHACWHPLDTLVSGTPAHEGATLPWGADHVFVITADRFLRNMVRAVVGTLVDVGRGKLSIQGFRRIIDQRDRCAAGTSMPAGPLFLHNITYPYPI